jgi:hypothetical protein
MYFFSLQNGVGQVTGLGQETISVLLDIAVVLVAQT